MTIKLVKQCSSAQKRIRDTSEPRKWMSYVLHGLQQIVIDEARVGEWSKRLQACVCTRDGRFQHLL